MAKKRVPALLERATAEALEALRQEELAIGQELTTYHDEQFRGLREQLQRHFLGHFVIRQPDRPPVWDAVAARQDGVVEVLTEELTELVEGVMEADLDLFAEELDWASVEGFDRELWFLALGGVEDVERYLDDLPADDLRAHLILLGAVLLRQAQRQPETVSQQIGTWADRLEAWGDLLEERLRRWFRGTVDGGYTLDDTLQGFDAMVRQFGQRVTGLFGNELHRAYELGAQLASEAARRDHPDIVHIWMTRGDRLVCPICQEKHLTITTEQPITDSHPGCRCRLVPIPADYRETPLDYLEFLARGRNAPVS